MWKGILSSFFLDDVDELPDGSSRRGDPVIWPALILVV
jgi:hypothetical protein